MLSTARVTIRDVAKAAGVSVSTISKVMNQRDGISEATQERVRAVIDDLGYVSSVSARSLRAARTGVIGVLIPDFEPYATEVLKGIARHLNGSPFELMAWSGGAGRDATRGWERRLVARLAVDHLARLGHRRIGFLGGREDLASARERERGYRDAMGAHRLPVDESLVVRGDYSRAGATEPARTLLSAPGLPSAIFAANDLSALRVLEVAEELGVRIPDDVSLVGFDDIPESWRCVPGLTTIAQPMIEIGSEAASLLLHLLDGDDLPEHDVKLATRLVVRESTRAPRP